MVEALQILKDIYSQFMYFIFNDMMIYTNVSLGWFLIGIFVFSILIKNLLMLPKAANTVKIGRRDDNE